MTEEKDTQTIMNPYVFPGLKVNEEEIKEIITKSFHGRNKISKDELLEIIASESGISVSDIVKRSRKKEIINARFIFCSILKNQFGYTLTRIGEHLDSRDHTSIRHALIQFNNRLSNEEHFRNLVHNIYNKMYQKTK